MFSLTVTNIFIIIIFNNLHEYLNNFSLVHFISENSNSVEGNARNLEEFQELFADFIVSINEIMYQKDCYLIKNGTETYCT